MDFNSLPLDIKKISCHNPKNLSTYTNLRAQTRLRPSRTKMDYYFRSKNKSICKFQERRWGLFIFVPFPMGSQFESISVLHYLEKSILISTLSVHKKKLLCGFCVRESVTVSVTMIARETVRENGVIKWVLIKFFRYFGNKTQSSADKQKKIGTESNCSPFADQSQMYSMRSTAYVFAHWEWSCLGALRAQKLQKMVSLFWNF